MDIYILYSVGVLGYIHSSLSLVLCYFKPNSFLSSFIGLLVQLVNIAKQIEQEI